MSTADVLEAKAVERRRRLAARARTSAEQRRTDGQRLAAHVGTLLRELPAGPVAAYASTGTEPDTGPLLAALPEALLPVLLPDGDLDWARAAGGLVPGPRGLREPAGPRLGREAVSGCVLVLVPGLGVDEQGTRLGRGGGSYDRALGRARGLVLALLHDGELVPHLPAEPHDQPVHGAVLPSGVRQVRPHPLRPAGPLGG